MSFDPESQGWQRFDDPALPKVMLAHWLKPESEGFAYGFETSEAQANGHGMVHGGILATYMDHTIGRVARLAAGGRVATIQLDLHYVAAGRPGQFIEARAAVVRRTRSVVFLRGELTADGKAILSASGIWKILGQP
ncbi:MAG: PaaI family thioesterase [Acetobacteraceae bacterium]|nr:PaaI family thioesterase [Acetobacteraceae bacterium]